VDNQDKQTSVNRKLMLALLAALSLSAGPYVAAFQPAGRPAAAAATSVPVGGPPRPGALAAAPASSSASSNSVIQLREHVERTRGLGTYITLFVFLVLAGLGLPLPEEVPLLLAGYLARHATANFWVLILVGLAGALSSDVLLFMATHRWRSHIFRWRWMRATIRPRHLVMARRLFHDHGLKIVIVARWLPALRSAVCLTAGLTGINFWRFMLVDAVAACITVPTSILLGYYAAAHIDRLITGFVQAEHMVLVGVVAALVIALVVRFVWWHLTSGDSKARSLAPQNGQPHERDKTPDESKPDVTHRSEVR
jgi:membrane protein DedA with SNARE-associated domain